jgi:hypothetical protein
LVLVAMVVAAREVAQLRVEVEVVVADIQK